MQRRSELSLRQKTTVTTDAAIIFLFIWLLKETVLSRLEEVSNSSGKLALEVNQFNSTNTRKPTNCGTKAANAKDKISHVPASIM